MGAEFQRMRAARLEFDAAGNAKVGVVVTGEVIEENGRLLAYVTPWLSPPLPSRDDSRRRTFNLELVKTGWDVFFPIDPSLPRDADLALAVDAAEKAWQNRLGAWHEFGDDLLLGYEYRACLKLGAADPTGEPPIAPADRVADGFRRSASTCETREILGLYGYHRIDRPHRLWVWQKDLAEARGILNLHDPA